MITFSLPKRKVQVSALWIGGSSHLRNSELSSMAVSYALMLSRRFPVLRHSANG